MTLLVRDHYSIMTYNNGFRFSPHVCVSGEPTTRDHLESFGVVVAVVVTLENRPQACFSSNYYGSNACPRRDVLSRGGACCPPVPNVVVGESPGRDSFHNITHPIVVPTKSPPLPILPTQGNGIVPPPKSRGNAPPGPECGLTQDHRFQPIVMPVAPLPRQSCPGHCQ